MNVFMLCLNLTDKKYVILEINVNICGCSEIIVSD
jgi:hypothetical protein